MKKEVRSADKDYLLEKFKGKEGYTYINIPEIPIPKTSFGMLCVNGTIDGHEFKGLNLMPLGNGNHFMPVSAEICRILKKKSSNTVHLSIYGDKTPLIIPEDLLLCLQDEEGLLEKFGRYDESRKKAFVGWINSARKEQTRIDRIGRIMNLVQNGEKSI